MRELAGLLIAPEGSTLQDILIDESAKLGDAALRQVARQALSLAYLRACSLTYVLTCPLALITCPLRWRARRSSTGRRPSRHPSASARRVL